MSNSNAHKQADNGQTPRVKRTAILLGLMAVAVYFGFIVATGLKG